MVVCHFAGHVSSMKKCGVGSDESRFIAIDSGGGCECMNSNCVSSSGLEDSEHKLNTYSLQVNYIH